jgi:hypothetical protein
MPLSKSSGPGRLRPTAAAPAAVTAPPGGGETNQTTEVQENQEVAAQAQTEENQESGTVAAQAETKQETAVMQEASTVEVAAAAAPVAGITEKAKTEVAVAAAPAPAAATTTAAPAPRGRGGRKRGGDTSTRRLGRAPVSSPPSPIVVEEGSTISMADFYQLAFQELSTEEGAARFQLPCFNVKADIERITRAIFTIAFEAGIKGAASVSLASFTDDGIVGNRHVTLKFKHSDPNRIYPNPRAQDGRTHTRTFERIRAELSVRIREGYTHFGKMAEDGETFVHILDEGEAAGPTETAEAAPTV